MDTADLRSEPAPAPARDGTFVQSLDRGLAVLPAGLPHEEPAAHLQRAEFARHTDRTVTDPVELRAVVEHVRRRRGCAVVDQELEDVLVPALLGTPRRTEEGLLSTRCAGS